VVRVEEPAKPIRRVVRQPLLIPWKGEAPRAFHI
jgi:hypothetical protein